MSWPLALVLAGCVLLALHLLYRSACKAGFREGHREGLKGVEDVALEAFEVGWKACELSRETSDVLGSSAHVEAQRRNAGSQ